MQFMSCILNRQLCTWQRFWKEISWCSAEVNSTNFPLSTLPQLPSNTSTFELWIHNVKLLTLKLKLGWFRISTDDKFLLPHHQLFHTHSRLISLMFFALSTSTRRRWGLCVLCNDEKKLLSEESSTDTTEKNWWSRNNELWQCVSGEKTEKWIKLDFESCFSFSSLFFISIPLSFIATHFEKLSSKTIHSSSSSVAFFLLQFESTAEKCTRKSEPMTNEIENFTRQLVRLLSVELFFVELVLFFPTFLVLFCRCRGRWTEEMTFVSSKLLALRRRACNEDMSGEQWNPFYDLFISFSYLRRWKRAEGERK